MEYLLDAAVRKHIASVCLGERLSSIQDLGNIKDGTPAGEQFLYISRRNRATQFYAAVAYIRTYL